MMHDGPVSPPSHRTPKHETLFYAFLVGFIAGGLIVAAAI
jgi:hypothetical protein